MPKSKDNITLQFQSEQHYWDDLAEGLTILLRNPNLSSDIRTAVSHFKVKLTNSLAGSSARDTQE